MRIILLGSAGMLGRAVESELAAAHQVLPRTRADYDIRDAEAFAKDLVQARPAAVINAAAYTKVDDAEDERGLADEVNGEAPGRLAAACAERGVAFVHPSTDYVFDGGKDSPYVEDDPTGPVNAYGRSKLLGEQRVAAAHPGGHLIIRTSWLFGAGGRNFIKAVIERWKAGQTSFRVVSDQRGRPTYTVDLARVLGVCLEKKLRGTYHAADSGETTWYDLARVVFATVGAEVAVEPVSSDEWKTRAARPRCSVLSTRKIERDAGILFPRHDDAVRRYLAAEGFLPGAEAAQRDGGLD